MNKLEKQILRIIGEDPDNPDVFTDDDTSMALIRDSINDAIQDIIINNGGYTETFSLPLVINKTFYRLTFKHGFLGWVQDAWLVIQKRRLTQSGLTGLNYFDPRWMTMTGTPEVYIPVGLDILGFHPKPSATSDIVELTCVVIPDNYKKEIDRIKLRDSFQWAVINYAVSEFWASRGDAREASKQMQTYLDNIGVRQRFSETQDRINQLQTVKSVTQKQEQRSIQ